MLDGRPVPPNLKRDAATVAVMVDIYCAGTHDVPRDRLCESCNSLLSYAHARLARCPFGAAKTTCRDCPIHCYRPAERAEMRAVMRYAGPRMLLRHPLAAVRHLWMERRGAPPWPPEDRGRRI